MPRIPRFFDPRRELGGADAISADEAANADVQFEMASALVFGLERRNVGVHFVEHCARVTALVEAMADKLGLEESEHSDLRAAAQLHEIGMIAVPAELIESRHPLDEVSLAKVRGQALIGAEILRATQTPCTARLVEHQYTDFDAIRRRFPPDGRELLFAGILRAADVLDTMLHPRPYQADLDPGLGSKVLRAGEGTRFHPDAVRSLLDLRIALN